jgi:hypothetical protein
MMKRTLFFIISVSLVSVGQATQCSMLGKMVQYASNIALNMVKSQTAELNKQFHAYIDAGELAKAQSLVTAFNARSSHKFNVTVQDETGMTALMKAVNQENVEFLDFLIEHGAAKMPHLYDVDKSKKTALEYAQQRYKLLNTSENWLKLPQQLKNLLLCWVKLEQKHQENIRYIATLQIK